LLNSLHILVETQLAIDVSVSELSTLLFGLSVYPCASTTLLVTIAL
jgi:hypothetical protein